MKKGVLTYAMIAMAIIGLMFTVSCAKKTVQSEPEVAEATPEPEPEPAPAPEPEPIEASQTGPSEREIAEDQFQAEHIYFEFDSSVLLPEAQNTLRQKAEFLRDYSDASVVVEGHCDERGTNAYNLALGERRAESARKFLIDMGIDPMRIETISFGEERPLDANSSEEAWAKNRRDQFLLQ